MDFDLIIQNKKVINNKNTKRNFRPFSSNPLGKKTQIKSKMVRAKTGFPKLKTEFSGDNGVKINNLNLQLDVKFDKTNEFRNNMKFRETRPKSLYNDKIFNRYWESIETEPKTIFDKSKKKIK